MDWGSFGTGVAVTVVGGLILWAIVASVHGYGRRRERKAKETEARNFARIPLRAGAVQVAQELRENADVAKRFEAGHRAPSDGRAFSLLLWRDFKGQIAQLQAEAPELWQELEEVYDALDLARQGVVDPPRSDDVVRLADRLDKEVEPE